MILDRVSILNDGETLLAKYQWEGYDTVLRYDRQGNYLARWNCRAGAPPGASAACCPTPRPSTLSLRSLPRRGVQYDVAADETPSVGAEVNADLSLFTETMVYYESFDGTRIPMFLVYPSHIEMDGSNPVILRGYGGFGASMGPFFQRSLIPWLERGGVYAVPCIRGGGEYGTRWHTAGIQENRPTVFRDFIAAAEFLIDSGYSSLRR